MADLTPINIYALSIVLIEQLDKYESTNILMKALKRDSKRLVKSLEQFDKNIHDAYLKDEGDEGELMAVVECKTRYISLSLNKKIR